MAGITSGLEYELNDPNLIVGEMHWFSMSAKTNNGGSSKMAIAQSCIPDMNVLCASLEDLIAEAITIPLKGRTHTNSGFTDAEVITIEIRNVGNNAVSNFDISYQMNGGAVVTENHAGTLAAGETLSYDFNQTADMSSVGSYTFNAWVDLENDINVDNNLSLIHI